MMLRKYLTLLIFLLAFHVGSAPASADDPQGHLPFQSYAREAGLKNLRINLLLQDKQGFIWVGTDNGLHRFDGQRFQEFGVAQGLPSAEVNALQLDDAGTMWAGTSKGPARWDGDRFESGFKGYPSGLSVEEIIVGPDHDLWIANDIGVFRGSAIGFSPVAGWAGQHVNTLTLDSDKKTVWVGTKRQLWTWSTKQGWKRFASGPFGEDQEELDRLFTAADGQIWARTSRASYVLHMGATSFTTIPELPRADSFLSRFHLAPDGSIWIPTEKGLYRYQNGNFTNISLQDGLPTDFARAALVDREGNLWCGSLGLHRIMGRGAWRSHTPKEGLPANVWSIFRDQEGRLWSGTEKGLAEGAEKAWHVIRGTENTLVRSIVQASDRSIIFGGEPYELQRWDKTKNTLQRLPPLPGEGRKVLHMLTDTSGHIWLGTLRAGLLMGSLEQGQWRFHQVALPNMQKEERVSHLMLDRQNRLWAASSAGLFMRENGQWFRYTTKDGLMSSDVLYISESQDGDVWVSFRDKPGVIARFNSHHGVGKTLQTIGAPRLPPIDIFLIGEDHLGRLWVGTNLGIDMLVEPRAVQGADTHFGVEQGLVDEESNAMAFLAESNGNTWIGTRGGLVHFESSQFAGDPPPPHVAVLSAHIGEQTFGAELNKKTVSHENNTFDIIFAGLSFVDTAGVEVETRLIGLEDAWHTAATRGARYPGLAPGHYRMELRARFRKNDWGSTTALSFEILPPWWQTWWFRAFLVLSIAGLIVFYEWRRVRNLKRRTTRLEALVAERTHELEIANHTMREQSLTDPLTGLRNRRYLTETMPSHIALVDRGNFNKALLKLDEVSLCNDLIFIILDIDHFKFVNDTFGHPAGDQMLKQVAEILEDCSRESDTVVRWGGEEFVVVAHQSCFREVATLLERIRSRFEAHQFDLGNGQTIQRTCSMGFAFYPFFRSDRQRFSWEQLIGLADQCLYVAKRSGRNMWVGLSPHDESQIGEICQRLPNDIAGLVSEGLVDIKTSSIEPTSLAWHAPAE